MIARRAAGEPLAYLTGTREFWGLQFEVSPAVLIPRPETELLVEAALERSTADAALRVADVCTGSGCIAVALAHDRPSISILATDISAAALQIASRNAIRHQVDARITLRQMDLLENDTGPFDLIVANPPYVPDGDRAALQREVRQEPELALFAGREGLDVVTRIVAQAPSRLRASGLLMFEFGAGQDIRIAEIIAAEPRLRLLEIKSDLQGIPRTAIVRHA